MTKWLFLVVLVISGGIMTFLYVDLQRMEQNIDALPKPDAPNTIRVVHAFKDGIHRYSGQIKLPHSCFSVHTDALRDSVSAPLELILAITTKDNLLEQAICSQITTRYPFEVIAEAPENVVATLRINDEERPIRIVETTWQSTGGATMAQ